MKDLTRFHTDDYIAYLKSSAPDRPDDGAPCTPRFPPLPAFGRVSCPLSPRSRAPAGNVTEDGDNPPFDGLFENCQIYAGATLSA